MASLSCSLVNFGICHSCIPEYEVLGTTCLEARHCLHTEFHKRNPLSHSVITKSLHMYVDYNEAGLT
jgi:hypothetical protein